MRLKHVYGFLVWIHSHQGIKSGQQKDIEQALIYAKLYKARKKS